MFYMGFCYLKGSFKGSMRDPSRVLLSKVLEVRVLGVATGS